MVDPAKMVELFKENAVIWADDERRRELQDGVTQEAILAIEDFNFASIKKVVKEATALRVAPGRYLINGETVILLDSQDMVVGTLIEAGRPLRFAELCTLSGYSSPHKTLKRILANHPKMGAFVHMPRNKQGGGYSTTIQNSPQSATKVP